jgi:hypothetical protein
MFSTASRVKPVNYNPKQCDAHLVTSKLIPVTRYHCVFLHSEIKQP